MAAGANELPIPTGLIAQFWQLFGLKQRDTLTALFALPAGVQVLTQLYDALHLSDLLRRFIRVWREVTRALWEQAIAFVNALWSWRLDFTTAELDALTLAALATGAAITSLLFRRGEALSTLFRRGQRYSVGVRALGYTTIILILFATAAVFLRLQLRESLILTAGLAWLQLLTAFGACLVCFFSMWFTASRGHREMERLARALREEDFEGVRATRFKRLLDSEWKKKRLGHASPFDDVERNAAALMELADHWRKTMARRSALLAWLFAAGFTVLTALLTLFVTERAETALVYTLAISVLIGCTAVNWKAFPIIFANVLLITLLNYGTLALTPAVEHIDGLIRQAGG